MPLVMLETVETERLEAELARRWALRRGAPSLEECERILLSIGNLMRDVGGRTLLLEVPLRDDTAALLRATADEFESPPEHYGLRRVWFRDVIGGQFVVPPESGDGG